MYEAHRVNYDLSIAQSIREPRLLGTPFEQPDEFAARAAREWFGPDATVRRWTGEYQTTGGFEVLTAPGMYVWIGYTS